MEHHFNIVLAQEYGIEESILIHNLYYWIHKNACNNKHCHEGRYWTYNTTKAFASLFPYMNETKIFRCLKHLEDVGFIIKGTFNEMKMDRTRWYSFTDEGISKLKSLGYNTDHFVKMKNGSLQNEMTIPNSNTNNNKEVIEEESSITKKDGIDYASLVSLWNANIQSCPKIANITKMSDKRRKAVKALLNACDSNVEELSRLIMTLPYADDWVLGTSTKGWVISFDWLIANTSNWYVRALEGEMHKKNAEIFKNIMAGEVPVPTPTESKGTITINGQIYR